MLDVIHFIRLIKGSIAALMVVAGGATALAVVSNGQAPYTATAPELTHSALQSTANRFRSEFPAPSENIHAWWPASTQSFTLGWQRSAAAAAPATTQTMPFTD
jgi:cytochrome c556